MTTSFKDVAEAIDRARAYLARAAEIIPLDDESSTKIAEEYTVRLRLLAEIAATELALGRAARMLGRTE